MKRILKWMVDKQIFLILGLVIGFIIYEKWFK